MSTKILHGPEFKHFVEEDTLGHFFFNNAEKYKDQICHIDATLDQTETFGSIKLRSTRVAIALQRRGITIKDVIIFCSSNTLDNTIPIFAAFFIGAKVTNLDSTLSVRHCKHLVCLTTPKIMFVEDSALPLIEESLSGTTFETEIIVHGKSEKYTNFSEFLHPQDNEEEFRPVGVDPDDVILMFFSSGTTGLPKAISHTHRSVLWMMVQAYQGGILGVLFHLSTFYWISAFLLCLCSFKCGGIRVLARNPSSEDFFKIIEKYKVSYIFLTPIFTYTLTSFQNPYKYDTSSLRFIACAGTPMATSQVEKMNKIFPSALSSLLYGMSEIGITSSFDAERDKELARKKLNSCGKILPGIVLKIVDPDTEEVLGCGQKGELRLKSPSIMAGYYKTDSSQVFDEDGFLKTGDIGYYDEDECLYVVERIKEMFKYQAWHIIPSVIEAVLVEHPSIREAVVFGLFSGEDGEVPAGCVVLEEGTTLSEKDIDNFLKERVADRERLRAGVIFVDVLPRTPTGKVVRNQVRDFVVDLNKREQNLVKFT